jgi:hypothetical protein
MNSEFPVGRDHVCFAPEARAGALFKSIASALDSDCVCCVVPCRACVLCACTDALPKQQGRQALDKGDGMSRTSKHVAEQKETQVPRVSRRAPVRVYAHVRVCPAFVAVQELYDRAETFIRGNSYDKAIELLQKVRRTRLCVSVPQRLRRRIEACVSARVVAQVVVREPAFVFGQNELAFCLERLQKYESALEVVKNALPIVLPVDRPKLLVTSARVKSKLKEHKRAVEDLTCAFCTRHTPCLEHCTAIRRPPS